MANRATTTYNGKTISTEDKEGSFEIKYNGKTLSSIGAGVTKTIKCAGKIMQKDIVIGGKTLLCAMKKMATDVVIAVASLFPSEPSSYNLIGKYTSNQTWTAPEDGYYQVEAFGASGNGGRGGHYYQTMFLKLSIAGGGGGGGGGGYACSRVKMKKGDTIVLSTGAVGSNTTAEINSSMESYSTLTVTSGANGTDTGVSSSGATAGVGGSGGVGSGGNYSNKTGGTGGNGTTKTSATSAATGGSGGTSGYSGGRTGGKGGSGYSTTTGLKYYDGAAGSAGFFKIYRGNTNLGGSSGGDSGGSVFYLQNLDGSKTLEFEFEEGMLWSDFVASGYNDGLFTMDDSTELQVTWSGTFTGIIKDCLGYNGFHVDPIGGSDGIYSITESDGNDSLEAGRTYYCNGVV